MIENFPLISQNDPRWRAKKLGSSPETIGNFGCLITSISSLLTYYGIPTNPDTFNDWLNIHDGYDRGNLYYWSGARRFTDSKVKLVEKIACKGLKAPDWNRIEAEIAAGRPVILEVDFKPQTDAPDMHWVVYLGNGRIMDSWNGKIEPLTKYGDPNIKIQAFVLHYGEVKGNNNMATVKELEEKLAKLQEKESLHYRELFDNGFRYLGKVVFNDEFPEGGNVVEYCRKIVGKVSNMGTDLELARKAARIADDEKAAVVGTIETLTNANKKLQENYDLLKDENRVLLEKLVNVKAPSTKVDFLQGKKTYLAVAGLVIVGLLDTVKALPPEVASLLEPSLQALGIFGIYMKIKRGEFDSLVGKYLKENQ